MNNFRRVNDIVGKLEKIRREMRKKLFEVLCKKCQRLQIGAPLPTPKCNKCLKKAWSLGPA